MFRNALNLIRKPRYRVIVVPKSSASELRDYVLNGKPVPRDCEIFVHRRSSLVGWDVDTTEQFDSVEDAVTSLRSRHPKRGCDIKVSYLIKKPDSTKC